MEEIGHFALLNEYLLQQRGTDFQNSYKLFFYINFAKKCIFQNTFNRGKFNVMKQKPTVSFLFRNLCCSIIVTLFNTCIFYLHNLLRHLRQRVVCTLTYLLSWWGKWSDFMPGTQNANPKCLALPKLRLPVPRT